CDAADRALLAAQHPFAALGVSGVRDQTNSVLDPSDGSLVTASLLHASRLVPPDQRFYGGGPNSVRGYARNELGPRVYVTDSVIVQGADTTYRNVRAAPTGGNATLVANLELRFATPVLRDRMRVALFADLGQVWERGDQVATVRGVRVTPGLGLRFV